MLFLYKLGIFCNLFKVHIVSRLVTRAVDRGFVKRLEDTAETVVLRVLEATVPTVLRLLALTESPLPIAVVIEDESTSRALAVIWRIAELRTLALQQNCVHDVGLRTIIEGSVRLGRALHLRAVRQVVGLGGGGALDGLLLFCDLLLCNLNFQRCFAVSWTTGFFRGFGLVHRPLDNDLRRGSANSCASRLSLV